MFDDDDFRRSELYFGALQSLRVCSEWIEETLEDLKTAHADCIEGLEMTMSFAKDCTLQRGDVKQLDSEWNGLRKKKEVDFQVLLQRIERKREEIKSLRDGVRIVPTITIVKSMLTKNSFWVLRQFATPVEQTIRTDTS